MPNINYFKNKKPSKLSTLVEKYKTRSAHKEIGVIDWWALDNREFTLEELKTFFESQDITFFYSSEILEKYDEEKTLYEISALAIKYNVCYIVHSTDDRFTFPNDIDRRYEVPWFVKSLSPIHIPSNFKDDMNYREKKYAFSMLLGREKPNRNILFRSFKDNPNFYSTYFGHPTFKSESTLEFEQDFMKEFFSDTDLNDIGSCTSIELDGNTYAVSHIIPADIFNNSHFSLISETRALKPEHFVTEKTGNQFLCSRFFLWYSSPDVRVYLQRYGINLEDWYPWIKYDEIVDDIKRLNLLIETAEEIASSELLQKEIYNKTKLSRRNNRLTYMNFVREYDQSLEDFVSRTITTPTNISII